MMSVWIHNETGAMMKAQYKNGKLIPMRYGSGKPPWYYQTSLIEWDWFDYV